MIGVVARYALEDNADDSSGNGHDGAIVGTPTFVNGAIDEVRLYDITLTDADVRALAGK